MTKHKIKNEVNTKSLKKILRSNFDKYNSFSKLGILIIVNLLISFAISISFFIFINRDVITFNISLSSYDSQVDSQYLKDNNEYTIDENESFTIKYNSGQGSFLNLLDYTDDIYLRVNFKDKSSQLYSLELTNLRTNDKEIDKIKIYKNDIIKFDNQFKIKIDSGSSVFENSQKNDKLKIRVVSKKEVG